MTYLALTEYIMSELNHIMPVVVWILWGACLGALVAIAISFLGGGRNG